MDPFSFGIILILLIVGAVIALGFYVLGVPLWLRRTEQRGDDLTGGGTGEERPEHLVVGSASGGTSDSADRAAEAIARQRTAGSASGD